MLTPTGTTSSAYWSAIKAGNPTHVRMTFLGQNIILDDSDIAIAGVTVNDIFNGDTDLVFGKTLSKQITMSIINSSKLDGLIWTGEFTLEFGVEIGTPAVTYWVNLGYFSGEKPNNVTTVNVIDFTAYDRMRKFDQFGDTFVQSISYPTTIQDIYDDLCTFVGVVNDSGDELPDIMLRSYASAPVDMEGYTCRDILGMIAEACGCYARINADGNCQMMWFTDNTSHAITGNEEFSVESGDINDGLIWNEADDYYWNDFDNFTWNDVCGYQEMYNIDQIQIQMLGNNTRINYPYNCGGNVYTIVDNPFLSVSSINDVNNYIAPLYNRVHSFGGYIPANVNCIGCWLVEAGDIVSVEINGNSYNIPIFVKTMRWNGAVDDSYETTGNRERSAYSSDADRQQNISAKYIRLFVEDNYYQIRSGIDITADGIVINGGKFVEIQSGSSITIKSGGNFNINSGSNIDIHATGTLDLVGSNVSIKSGSTFEVDSTNFKIDSVNKYMKSENTTFNSNGIDIALQNSKHFKIGKYNGFNPSVAAGVYTDIDSNSVGKVVLYTSPQDSNYASSLFVECSKVQQEEYYHTIIYGDTAADLGKLNNRFQYGYIRIFVANEMLNNNSEVTGGSFNFVLDPLFDSCETQFIGDRVRLSIFQRPNFDNGYIVISTNDGLGSPCTIKTYQDWVFGTVYYSQLIQNSTKDIKHDINVLEPMGDIIDRLNPVTFVYDDDPTEQKRYGLIYEDTIDVLPDICTNEENNKAINYVELVPILLKEIQELRARVKSLEEREE